MNNVCKTIIHHPFGKGLYHLFMLIWWMVYYCLTHITPNYGKKTISTSGKLYRFASSATRLQTSCSTILQFFLRHHSTPAETGGDSPTKISLEENMGFPLPETGDFDGFLQKFTLNQFGELPSGNG